jgi:hypothetical protein
VFTPEFDGSLMICVSVLLFSYHVFVSLVFDINVLNLHLLKILCFFTCPLGILLTFIY